MALHDMQRQQRSRCISYSEPVPVIRIDDSQSYSFKSNLTHKSFPPTFSPAATVVPLVQENEDVSLTKKRNRSQSVCFENNMSRSKSHFHPNFDVPKIVVDQERPPTPSKSTLSSDTDLEKPTQRTRKISLADSVATKSCSTKKMALLRSPIFLAYLARLSISSKENAVDAVASAERLKQMQEDLETRGALEEIRRMLSKADQNLTISRSSSRYTSGISTPVSYPVVDKSSPGVPLKRSRSPNEKSVTPFAASSDKYQSLPTKPPEHSTTSNAEQAIDSSYHLNVNSCKPSNTPRSMSRVQSFIINRDLNAIAPSSY